MVEISREELTSFERWFNDEIRNLHNGKTDVLSFERPELGLKLNVSISTQKLSRNLTEEVICRIRDNEISLTNKIAEAIFVSQKSARLTYYCLVYKILESDHYHYKTDTGSRLISLSYFCSKDIFNLRYATIHGRLNNDSYAYCHYDLEKFDINKYRGTDKNGDIRYNMKILKKVSIEIRKFIQC